MGGLVVALLSVLGLSRLEVDTGVSSLVPASDRTVRDWEAAQRSFGGDPVLVLLEARRASNPGALLAPAVLPRLVALEGRLAKLDNVAVVYGPGTVANQIAGQVQDLLLTLSAQRDAIKASAQERARSSGASEEAVAEAGRKAAADFEARYGALIAAGLPVGLPTLNNPTFAPRIFLADNGDARPEFRWIVPDGRRAAVYVRPREGLGQEATDRLVRAVRSSVTAAKLPAAVTVTGAPVVATALGEAVRDELPKLAVASLVAIAVAFLLTHRPGGDRERRQPLSYCATAPRRMARRLAPLAMALAASGFTLGMFGLAGAEISLGLAAFLPIMVGVGSDFPIQVSHPAARRTVLATAAASAAGFAALVLSPLPFVRSLGLALALGIVSSCALGLVFARRADAAAIAAGTGAGGGRVGVSDRRLVAAGVVLAAVGLALLPGLRLESRPDRLAEGLGAIDDARKAEKALGASGEVAVWVRGSDVLSPDTLAWFRKAEGDLVVSFGDRLRPVVSPGRLLRFLGESPTDSQIDAALRVLPKYLAGATIRSDQREAVISFGLRLGDLSQQSDLIRQVERRLPAAPPGLTVDVTGLPVVAARAQDLLADSRVVSNLSGLALVAVVLVAGLRRRGDAAVAALAAALAFGWGLVLLRLAGTSLSPLTVSLGTLTAAVGAEFTVFARERVAAGVPRPWAGVVAAAATSVAGFGALAVSRLQVLREFGLVLAGSVLLSLLAARLLTPSAAAQEGVPAA